MNNRTEIKHPTKKLSLAYGKDHACGWFVQVWDTTDYPKPDCDNILVDKDAMFDGLTQADIVAVAQQFGFPTDAFLGVSL